ARGAPGAVRRDGRDPRRGAHRGRRADGAAGLVLDPDRADPDVELQLERVRAAAVERALDIDVGAVVLLAEDLDVAHARVRVDLDVHVGRNAYDEVAYPELGVDRLVAIELEVAEVELEAADAVLVRGLQVCRIARVL